MEMWFVLKILEMAYILLRLIVRGIFTFFPPANFYWNSASAQEGR